MALVIDLITPPSSPGHEGQENKASALGKRKASCPPGGDDGQRTVICLDSDDDECEVIERPERPVTVTPAMASSGAGSSGAGSSGAGSSSAGSSIGAATASTVAPPNDDDDDDLQYVSHTGAIALSDFPHARENCAACPFKPGGEQVHCANCYCYVCDGPAAQCPVWVQHCKATHKSAAWKKKRADWKKNPPAAAAAAAGAAAAPAAAAPAVSVASVARTSMNGHLPAKAKGAKDVWTCERVLKAVEQVYPVETAEPAGLKATLRPYQKQSLAFMLDIETASVAGGTPAGGWLCDEMCAAALTPPPPSPVPPRAPRVVHLSAWSQGHGQDVCRRRAHPRQQAKDDKLGEGYLGAHVARGVGERPVTIGDEARERLRQMVREGRRRKRHGSARGAHAGDQVCGSAGEGLGQFPGEVCQ